MYLPNIITAVSVAALFMRFFSNSNMCLVNGLLTSAGKDAFMFEDNAAWSRAIVMFIQTWLWFGNTMIMMMSGILGINPSLFEAAAIDGATSGQVLRKVTLPLLRPDGCLHLDHFHDRWFADVRYSVLVPHQEINHQQVFGNSCCIRI